MTASTPPLPLRSRAGVALTLLASGAQVLAAFHHWHPDGDVVAVDLALRTPASPLGSVGVLLLVLAAVPALAALAIPSGWPRGLSAFATGVLVLAWVGLGPVGPVATGVWLAAGAVCGHLVAAALAR
ncbi:MAG: hypothetical protein KY457_02085 [Actinobacteria bacterium]|nr:hypothetical protein [Actinomycetota bacterium]